MLLLQPTHTAEQKRLGAVTHGLINGTALLLFTTAVAIIIYNKEAHHGAHFASAHGRIGLITYILLVLQVYSLLSYEAKNPRLVWELPCFIPRKYLDRLREGKQFGSITVLVDTLSGLLFSSILSSVHRVIGSLEYGIILGYGWSSRSSPS